MATSQLNLTPVMPARFLRALLAVSMAAVTAVLVPTGSSRADRLADLHARGRATGDWPQFHDTADHAGVNASETAIGVANAASLAFDWSYATAAPITGSPTVSGGVAYIGSGDGKLYALDSKTGALKWSYATGAGVNAAPAVSGGVVYFGNDAGTVYALDAATGALKWSFATPSQITGAPTVVGTTLYVASMGNAAGSNGEVRAISTTTGTQLWMQFHYANTWSSPTVAGGVLYIGWDDNNLYAYDAATGALKWQATAGGKLRCVPSVSGGVVYIGSDDGKLYAFDALTGVQKWASQTAPVANSPIVRSSPAVSNGLVYVDTGETTPMAGSVYAFNTTTGAMVWNSPMADYATSSVAIANGVAYAGSFSHNLYAFDAAVGTKLFASSFQLIEGGLPSSPAVSNGVIYIGSLDDSLYAFNIPSGYGITSFVGISETGFDPSTVINQTLGTSVKWTNGGTGNHTVTDTSGMGLFDSGTMAPGAAFTWPFIGAGNYTYKDSLHPTYTGTVKAPVVLTPATGTLTTVFTIKWAGGPPPAGYVFDVNIQRPGGSWQTWLTGQIVQSATFVPDGGKGTYYFKGRLTKSGTSLHSAWCTAKTIVVS